MIALSRMPVLERVDTHPHGRHYREPGGRLFTSVTNVSNIIDKPFLKNWAAKLERQDILTKVQTIYEQLPAERVHPSDFMRWVKAQFGKKYYHEIYTQQAAEWGTALHEYLEYQNRLEMGLPVDVVEPPLPPGGELARDQYFAWRLENEIHMLGAEVRLVSYQYEYAGTMDWLGIVQAYGRITLGDWKSSKSFHNDMYLQNAAYIHAAREMGLVDPDAEIDGVIVRLPMAVGAHYPIAGRCSGCVQWSSETEQCGV